MACGPGASPVSATLEDWVAYLKKTYGVNLVRAEDSDSIDALLAGGDVSTEVDDQTLEDLLSATEDELESLTK